MKLLNLTLIRAEKKLCLFYPYSEYTYTTHVQHLPYYNDGNLDKFECLHIVFCQLFRFLYCVLCRQGEHLKIIAQKVSSKWHISRAYLDTPNYNVTDILFCHSNPKRHHRKRNQDITFWFDGYTHECIYIYIYIHTTHMRMNLAHPYGITWALWKILHLIIKIIMR